MTTPGPEEARESGCYQTQREGLAARREPSPPRTPQSGRQALTHCLAPAGPLLGTLLASSDSRSLGAGDSACRPAPPHTQGPRWSRAVCDPRWQGECRQLPPHPESSPWVFISCGSKLVLGTAEAKYPWARFPVGWLIFRPWTRLQCLGVTNVHPAGHSTPVQRIGLSQQQPQSPRPTLRPTSTDPHLNILSLCFLIFHMGTTHVSQVWAEGEQNEGQTRGRQSHTARTDSQAGDLGRVALEPHFLPLQGRLVAAPASRGAHSGVGGQCKRGLGTAGSHKRSASVGIIYGRPPGLHSGGKHPSEFRGGQV